MNTPQEPFRPVSKEIEHLQACAFRASGLIHLLAVAAANTDEGYITQPSEEAAEGIFFLAMHTSSDLKAAVDAVSAAPLGTLETQSLADQ